MSQFDPYGNNRASSPYQTKGTNPVPPSILNSLDQNQLQFFLNQGYTRGLLKKLLEVKSTYFQRCWIVDNGNAMQVNDSHRLVINQQNGRIESIAGVKRWDELLETISTQAWVSSYLNMPMRFALLNKPGSMAQYFTMGENDDSNKSPQEKVHKVGQILKSIQPGGPTNLTKQLNTIYGYISSIAHQLRSSNQKVSLVIATQGLPTNDNGESNQQITQEFVMALKAFENVPATITLRLCTDNEQVFHFYKATIDCAHISHDIIDDYSGEALEVYLQNPWLTYVLSLHRFRELGLHVKVFDLLDERLLTFDELHEFCSIVFETNEMIPHPQTHWTLFLKTVSSLLQKEMAQWNPVKKKFMPLIDIFQLKLMYENKQSSQASTTNNHFSSGAQQQQQQQSSNTPTPSNNTNPQRTVSNPTPPPTAQPPTSPSLDEASIKKNLLMTWALLAPTYQALKPLPELLATIQLAFPPAFGVNEHKYFQKWKVLCLEGLSSGGHSVVKRAHRKAKFLLHPDKLPKDLDENQQFVCKLIWDILADSWGIYETNNPE